ncbi:VCBS repeat-containing protein [Oscillospiraceae bacterium WX1]
MNGNLGERRIYNSINGQRVFLLDYKRGDVTGDGVPDNVYLYGNKPGGPSSPFADNITLVIQDGRYNQAKAVAPRCTAGYHAQLFLGDFDQDLTCDIQVSLEAGGSGGYIYSTVYSYKKQILRELFDSEAYNSHFQYAVDYHDFYRVSVTSGQYNRLFFLDISGSVSDGANNPYGPDGRLLRPTSGSVLPLGALTPIANSETGDYFDLLAAQRIIGLTNADTLGTVENLLTWDGQRFALKAMTVSIPGVPLTNNV